MTTNLEACITFLASGLILNTVFLFSTLITCKDEIINPVFGNILASIVLEIMAFIMLFYLVS